MDTTPNLALPYLAAAQSQKHVTHNEALRALDALIQLAVVSRVALAPPAGPGSGVRYIIPAGATGVWAGHDLNIAAWQDGAWAFFAPLIGWLAYVADEAKHLAARLPDAPTPWDKVAHFCYYGLMAVLLVHGLGRRWLWVPLVLVPAVGALDEWHQFYVPGRDASVFDWMADAAGTGVAVFAFWRIRGRDG